MYDERLVVVWMAGLVDCDGYIRMECANTRGHHRQWVRLAPTVGVCNTCLALLDKAKLLLSEALEIDSRIVRESAWTLVVAKRWHLVRLLAKMKKHLVVKPHQAELVLEHLLRGPGKEYRIRDFEIWWELRLLNYPGPKVAPPTHLQQEAMRTYLGDRYEKVSTLWKGRDANE